MSFEKRLETGRCGEGMVDAFLKQKGWVPYYPTEGVAHPFDRLVASKDKRRLCIVEVKTKFQREAYDDTGIERRHFDDYQHITSTYQVPLFLVFVDARAGTISGNWWANLLEPREPSLKARCGGCVRYPWAHGGQVYFPISALKVFAVIPEPERQKVLGMRVSGWVPSEPVERPEPVRMSCKHKTEFVVNGRCWICEHV